MNLTPLTVFVRVPQKQQMAPSVELLFHRRLFLNSRVFGKKLLKILSNTSVFFQERQGNDPLVTRRVKLKTSPISGGKMIAAKVEPTNTFNKIGCTVYFVLNLKLRVFSLPCPCHTQFKRIKSWMWVNCQKREQKQSRPTFQFVEAQRR